MLSLSDLEPESALGNYDPVDSLNAGCDVRAILGRAPAKIAQALLLIYVAGEAMSTAARAVGMSRFTLSREITRFARTMREAGAA